MLGPVANSGRYATEQNSNFDLTSFPQHIKSIEKSGMFTYNPTSSYGVSTIDIIYMLHYVFATFLLFELWIEKAMTKISKNIRGSRTWFFDFYKEIYRPHDSWIEPITNTNNEISELHILIAI